jgi:hypothetical protein
MSDTQPSPPRWACALLESLSRPSDADSISGDLLEEYREARRPALGRLRADAWYVKHVLSMLWHVAWPCVAAITALRILSFPLPRGWNPGLVPAPGVSLLDAVVLGLYFLTYFVTPLSVASAVYKLPAASMAIPSPIAPSGEFGVTWAGTNIVTFPSFKPPIRIPRCHPG